MRLLIVVLLIVMMTGCDKQTDVFVFDCSVYNERLDIPVANAAITMAAQRVDGGFNPNFETISSATTDAEGRFVVEVEKEVFYSIRVAVDHPDHFAKSFEIDPDKVPFSTAFSETYIVEPKAWIATEIINQNMSQTITFSVDADNGTCSECCPSGNTILQGSSIDTVFVCPVVGEQEVTISGNYVDENGGIFVINETAYVTAFDTTTVTVVY